MNYEFYNETKKNKSSARYIVWAIFIMAIVFFTFYLFLSGIKNIAFFFKNQTASVFSQIEKKGKDNYELISYNLKKNGIEFVNDLPEGEVLGVKIFSKNQIKNYEKYGKTLSMFRGNPSRTWYGSGNIPEDFEIKWRYPKEAMCSLSIDKGETKEWCGSGWTGQPVVYEHDGKTEIIFGAYDKKVHFVNAKTGEETRPAFETGDIIKGSVTLDPDGFPLLYFGSRDNKLRILSLEDNTPKELWALDSKTLPGIWNDDWDGNPVIIDDFLFTGGENGWFFVIKLGREYDSSNKLKVSPEIVFSMPSYNDEFLNKLGDSNVSIENSVAIYENIAYFANSGGRILGIDLTEAKNGMEKIVFDYWVGDDVDASIVIDDDGKLYISVEEERLNDRSKEMGQIIKIDPKKKDPMLWNIKVPSTQENISGGVWSTPALHKNNLYVVTNTGELLVINKNSGEIIYKDKIGIHSWSSPIISNDELLVSTCQGIFLVYDIDELGRVNKTNEFQMPGGSCIESTPALWDGNLYFGSRDGFFYKIGEKE